MSETKASLPSDVDPRMWFEMAGCDGYHYLVDGNPHIRGRMYFYCPVQGVYTRISKIEISQCSDEAHYFIRGYLSGNEPPPPRDDDNDVLDNGDPRFAEWRRAAELFRDTGFWYSGKTRTCQQCSRKLLPSELSESPCVGCQEPSEES